MPHTPSHALGQDLQTPVDPGVVPGAPTTPEEAATRKEQWKQVLGSPEFGAALAQFSIAITQPRATVDTGLAQTTRAVGQGFEAANRVVGERQQRDITERQQQVSERGAATQEQRAATEQERVDLERRRLEEKDLPESEANIEGTRATTEATRGAEERAKLMAPIQRELEAARKDLLNAQTEDQFASAQARMKNAQTNRINALANRTRARIAEAESQGVQDLRAAQTEAQQALATLRDAQAQAGGFGGSASLQHLNALAGSLQRVAAAKGISMTNDQARLAAQQMLKTTSASSREQFVQDTVKDYIETRRQFDEDVTDEDIMRIIEQAEVAADVMNLQSISSPGGVSLTGAPPGQEQGTTLETFDQQKAFVERHGGTLGTETVLGTDINGNTVRGLPILDPQGAQVPHETTGLPRVIVP